MGHAIVASLRIVVPRFASIRLRFVAKKAGAEDWLPEHKSTVGWRKLHSCAPPLQVPTAAEIDAHSALVDENLLICPCQPNRTGAPKKGKRIPGVFDLIQRPPQKRKITCSLCRRRGHNKLQCKNTDAHLRRWSAICVLLAACLCNCGV